MRLAVVDVGSHTVRLEIADSGEAATLPVHTAKWRLRLARRVKADGHIPAGEVDRVCQAVAAARDEAQEWGAQEVFAVATAVVRAAPNRREVLDAVHDRSGVPLRVLSGKREAELAFLAARRWMGWQAGPLALVDIGGGSLEVAFGRTGLPDFAASAPLGAGLVTREFFAGQDPPRPRQIKAVRREVRRQLREPAARVRWEAPRTAVATSRTFEQLARLCGSAPKCDGPFVPRRLERGDLRRAVKQLASMPAGQRAKLPGISSARAEQSLAGAVVADVTMELLGLESVTICPWALREGVLLHRLESGDAAGWTPLERIGRGAEVGAGRHG